MSKTLYFNGPIITMENAQARAVLVEDGKIVAVGDQLAVGSDTVRRDLQGASLLPGFVDSHSHITAVAQRLLMVDLSDCKTAEELLDKLASAHSSQEWLFAMGYDRLIFDRRTLDRVSDTLPILCTHASGHIAVANTPALKLLGYWGNFSVPDGGTVERLPDGTPSGVLVENAYLAPQVQSRLPALDHSALQWAMSEAGRLYASCGITTAQDARVGETEYRLLQDFPLPLDVVAHAVPEAVHLLDHSSAGDRLRMVGYKIFLDGSIQGRTAWLSSPYWGNSDRGKPIHSDKEVLQAAMTCLKHGWQLNSHCNGDAACEQLLRCYALAMEETGIRQNLRPVMLHAQTVRPDQLDRMASLGICASFFLDHVYHWGDDHRERYLGPDRAARISPIRSALDRGVPSTLHQDSPVIRPNPLSAVHNAVNRRTSSGFLLGPQERISVLEALKAVTAAGAYQSFEEASKGSIAPGKRADFVLLGENPLTADPSRLKDIPVLETIKDGVTIYRA